MTAADPLGKNLTGIECLTGLTTLDLWDNIVSDVSALVASSDWGKGVLVYRCDQTPPRRLRATRTHKNQKGDSSVGKHHLLVWIRRSNGSTALPVYVAFAQNPPPWPWPA